MRHIVFLYLLFTSISVMGQKLRIDFDRINKEVKQLKTNKEAFDFLKNETESLAKKFGKNSKEYIYLKSYYLDQYYLIYQPYKYNLPIDSIEYNEGRKELLILTQDVYGDTSKNYANAILQYVDLYTSVYVKTVCNSCYSDLLFLNQKAANIFNTAFYESNENRYSDLRLIYFQRSQLFSKNNNLDSTTHYFQIVLDNYKNHPSYDAFYPAFLVSYSYIIANKNTEEALNFLLNYLPKIKEKYANSETSYFYYLKSLANLFLSSGLVNKQVMIYITELDNLCKKIYGELSKEYVNILLNYKISLLKKLGYKSAIPNALDYLNVNIFEKDRTLFDIKNFIDYHLEWHYYYKSIGDQRNSFKALKWIEKSDIDTTLNRTTFASKITVYRELADYYRFKRVDSCIDYKIKVAELEEKAKLKWGNYVVHQYHEIAKLALSLKDTVFSNKAFKFALLALAEFDEAYGSNSHYTNSARFTIGRILLYKFNDLKGLEYLYPEVYSNLSNPNFIPPLNSSDFQVYGDFLSTINKPDSADFFYNEIFLRNNSAQYFRILGSPEQLITKSLQDISTQAYSILNEHLKRFKKYKFVSTELAEYLFKKNLYFQMQLHINNAYSETKGTDPKSFELLLSLKNSYDSIIASETSNAIELDSIFYSYDNHKSNLLQQYILKHSKDTSRLANLSNDLSYSNIKEKLKSNICFVDIVRFLKSDEEYGFDSQNPIYAFVLIDKNSGEKLEYTFIENGAVLEKLVLAQEDNTEKISAILAPLLKRLKNYNSVYFNPDGIFNILNLYSLKDENGEYLIKTKTIHYINTLDIENVYNIPQKANITLFGNPVFGSSNSTVMRSNGNAYNSFTNLSSLPYTKVEVETTVDIVAKKNWNVTTFTENECSETKLNAVTNSNILHIATHGYYFDENDTANLSYAMQQNPFLRSGLVMGKVNKNTFNQDDNILSAYEVMNLDLKNTSLVVLSACQSAKGELKPGQGVYGLQRAFKIAGAENVLVSVKNVNDKSTQLLMKYFYTNVANGSNYVDALRKAQLDMLKHPLFYAPKYWDGFILIEK